MLPMSAREPMFRCEHWDKRLGEQCGDEQLPESKFCILHAPPDQMDLAKHQARNARAARYRLQSKVVPIAEVLAEVALNPEESGMTRVRAAEAVLDRTGLPRVTAAQVTLDGSLDVSVTDMRKAFWDIQNRVAARTHEIVDAAEALDDLEFTPPPVPHLEIVRETAPPSEE